MQFKPFTLLAAGSIAALLAAGCAKGSDQSSSTSTTTTTTSTSVPAATTSTSAPAATTSTSAPATAAAATSATAMGDPAHGKAIFTSNCASCHGATGTEGGVGPSLKSEKSRKNYAQTVAWIKNPQPPMPKLFPSPLSEKDVEDVAAYVETL